MKKNLQRFGASVLAAAMVAQSVALPAAAETTKIDSSVAQSVAASAASAASAVQSLPKFTSTADLIKQTAQTLAAQGEVHELEQDDAKLEATAQSKAGMSLAALENALADAMYANAAAGKINTEAYGLNKDEMASVMAATIKTYHLSSAVTDLGYETNAAGVVTAVTFTGSSGMTSFMKLHFPPWRFPASWTFSVTRSALPRISAAGASAMCCSFASSVKNLNSA